MKWEIIDSTSSCGRLATKDGRGMGVPEVPPRSNRLILALPRYQSWLASNSIAVMVVARHNE